MVKPDDGVSRDEKRSRQQESDELKIGEKLRIALKVL